jgi:deoxyribonuclease-4
MSDAVSRILEHTDHLCPLLIETPAGQGSEMLKNKDDFLTFIQQFSEQDRIGACVDTCHVFACGYKPSEYLKFIGDNGLLKLVHYNDSNDTCGSCKDRHAFVGSGHIGLPEMTSVADYCGANGIPMVIE